MVEKKGLGKAIGHAFLWFGIAIVLFPLYIALVATTHTFDVLIGSTPLWFGGEFLKNFTTVLTQGLKAAGGIPVWVMMANSLVMALGIAIGKIAISITAAYAIVYFRFPGRELCFVLIFITLMMPVEVRIVPTFQVAANLNFIDSYLGLVLPLIASATATFLYRQMFMTIPAELLEAARIDGANSLKILFYVTIPNIKNSLALCALLRTIDSFRLFDKVNLLTGGGPANSTSTITQYLYNYGIKSLDFGFGSAGAIVMTVLVLLLSSVYIKRAIS